MIVSFKTLILIIKRIKNIGSLSSIMIGLLKVTINTLLIIKREEI